MKTAREISADILCEVDAGAMSHSAFNMALRKNALSESDRGMVKMLVNGTLEHLTEIDEIISSYSKKHISKLKPIVRNVLRISIYQLKYLTNIPQSAVCNEAVKIIDRRKIYGLKGFVNAVLRDFSSKTVEMDTDENGALKSQNKASRKSSPKSQSEIPDYIAGIIKKRAHEDYEKVVRGFDAPSKLTCRFNLSRASEDEILESLKSQEIIAKKIESICSDDVRIKLDNAYELEGYTNVGDIDAFRDGLIQIQGVTSILTAQILNPEAGSKVLDICSAPGGKTIALADIIRAKEIKAQTADADSGMVVARDLTEKKVNMIRKNAERSHFENVIAEQKDATEFYPEDESKYDYVMADLPCSGLGTIGHKPEIRYRVDETKVKELANLQRQILDNAVRYVKPGGYLVYSTCTISFEENEENYDYISEVIGPKYDIKPLKSIQILPGIFNASDGFYISLFKRD